MNLKNLISSLSNPSATLEYAAELPPSGVENLEGGILLSCMYLSKK